MPRCRAFLAVVHGGGKPPQAPFAALGAGGRLRPPRRLGRPGGRAGLQDLFLARGCWPARGAWGRMVGAQPRVLQQGYCARAGVGVLGQGLRAANVQLAAKMHTSGCKLLFRRCSKCYVPTKLAYLCSQQKQARMLLFSLSLV